MYAHLWGETKATKGDFITNINYKYWPKENEKKAMKMRLLWNDVQGHFRWKTHSWFYVLLSAHGYECISFLYALVKQQFRWIWISHSSSIDGYSYLCTLSMSYWFVAFGICTICSGNEQQFLHFAHICCFGYKAKIDRSRSLHYMAIHWILTSSKYCIAIRSYIDFPVFPRHNFFSKSQSSYLNCKLRQKKSNTHKKWGNFSPKLNVIISRMLMSVTKSDQ